MKEFNNIKLNVFVHIERSGGTTFNSMLINNFLGYLVPKIKSPVDQKKEKDPNRLIFTNSNLKEVKKWAPNIKVLGGHHTRIFAEYEKIINGRIFYFTFLRDPVSRYLSHYNFQRNVMKINWTLTEFLNNYYFNNWQTKRIAGVEDVEIAKSYVAGRFDFVGLTEHYDESLLIFREKIGLNTLV